VKIFPFLLLQAGAEASNISSIGRNKAFFMC
jgi:hypothetical protein